MKTMPCIIAVAFWLCIAVAAPAANDPSGGSGAPRPNISNPAGMGRVPPSTYYKAGKTTTDIYAGGGAGNLIVTGDVAGGRQFRGVVPYGSTSSFEGRTGMEAIDSFQKRTQGVGYGGAPGAVEPYYGPSRTGTNLPDAGGAGLEGVSIKGTGGKHEFLQPAEAKSQELSLQDLARQYRPLSRTPQEVIDAISRQVPVSQTETSLLKAINDVHQKELVEELEKVKADAAELVKKAQEKKNEKNAVTVTPEKPLETKPLEPLEQEQPVAAKPADIYDKMMQQLDKDFEEYMKSQKTEKESVVQPEKPADVSETDGSVASLRKPSGLSESGDKTRRMSEEKANLNAMLRAGKTGQKQEPSELNAAGYKLYMDLAAEYMKQKKYYRAAETYPLARLYENRSESYAAQGWALFATGEYMSSAYYLGKSIEMDPNAATRKVDLAALIGQERLMQRLSDLELWQKKTYSAELQFLLAYVYYQTGKTRDAEDEIRSAAVKLDTYNPASVLRGIIIGNPK
jgi:tetratricopeptide (TPR) repeat protein